MKIKNRQQVFAFVAIGLVALWAGDKLLLTPLANSWSARAKRITELRRQVGEGRVVLERDRVIQNRWDSMRTNTLPENTSLAEQQLFEAFDRWSRDSGISVTSVKPQWKRNSDEYSTLECRVDAYGSLSAVTRFLYGIEKDPLALKVETAELTARDNSGQQLTLGLVLSGLRLGALPQ